MGVVPSKSRRLREASKNGEIEKVLQLIKDGASIEKLGESGKPINIAAKHGHLNVVKALIDSNADIDSSLAMHTAAGNGNLEIVKALIAAGGNVNKADGMQYTPIFQAVIGEHYDVMHALIEAESDLRIKSFGGQSVLYYAVAKGQQTAVDALIEAGADVNEKHEIKWYEKPITPLYKASLDGHASTVKSLLNAGAQIDSEDSDGYTALFAAIFEGQVEVVRILIKERADVNKRDNDGFTPIHHAANSGDVRAVDVEIGKLLINAGAKVNVASKKGIRPLHFATLGKNLELCNLLISNGARLEEFPLEAFSTPRPVFVEARFLGEEKEKL